MKTAAWIPKRYTAPLSDDFPTDGDRLLKLVDLAAKNDDGTPLVLDEDQRWLIRHALELYPADWPVEHLRGKRRYTSVVISQGRQNGKSVIGSVFGLYGLCLAGKGKLTVGLAGKVEQANIIYGRVRNTINNNATLKARYMPTGTRGIYAKNQANASRYIMKAGKADSLQGFPIDVVLFDEIHLVPEDVWSAVSFGTSQTGGIIIGTTTAGVTGQAKLLMRLYEDAEKAIAGDPAYERMGFFIWEAEEDADLLDPQALIDANPAIAVGRMSLEEELRRCATLPESDVRQYRHNRMVNATSTWIRLSDWQERAGALRPAANITFAVDRAKWDYATITASTKIDGVVHTRVVERMAQPSIDGLEDKCITLHRKHPTAQFVMEGFKLKELKDRLKDKGVEAASYTRTDMSLAAGTAYALVKEDRLRHDNNSLVRQQLPFVHLKNFGEGARLIAVGEKDIDALIATVMGIHAAENWEGYTMQLHVPKVAK